MIRGNRVAIASALSFRSREVGAMLRVTVGFDLRVLIFFLPSGGGGWSKEETRIFWRQKTSQKPFAKGF